MDAVLEVVNRGAAARKALDGAAEGLSLLMNELSYGVLLATPRGKLVHANMAARHELARRENIELREGHVHAPEPAQARILAQALAKADAGRRSLVALRAESGRLSIAFVPLRMERAHDAPSVALILSRPVLCDAVMLCFFARCHGLTPSEEHVLAILCRGYSAPQAAEQLHVAVSTVRSHVRSMCAKTGTKSVRALIGQVAVLPPIGAARVQDPLH